MTNQSKGGMPDGMKAIMGWTLGVGIIAFVLLILVIIFGNLSGNVGFTQDSTPVANETILFTDAGSTPATAQGRTNGVLTNVVVINATNATVVAASNYTVSGVIITADGASDYNGTNVKVTATVSFDSQAELDSEAIILNYTSSATNTAAQFPTVGTIVGIALLLLILIALLVFAIRRMMGVASTTGGNGSANFGSDANFG